MTWSEAADPNPDPNRMPWVLTLKRFMPDRSIQTLRRRMGWLGPRWQRVRDTPEPWNDREVMTEMSSGLGFDARALIPEFVRRTAAQAERQRRHDAALDDEIMKNDPAVLERVAQLKADARARPLRKR